MSTFIIAEAGVNHNGDFDTAIELIKVAKDSGADAVKFQTFKAKDLVTPGVGLADYQGKQLPLVSTQYEMLENLELSHADFAKLKAYADLIGIEFLSTGFNVDDIEYLMRLGMKKIKIPSGEITNKDLLDFVGRTECEVILSSGMSTGEEIEQALFLLSPKGVGDKNITVLHCNSQYPAPFEEINLRSIPYLKARFGYNTGYSDHTLGIEAAIAAIALGATMIEKHFTLDTKMVGPDHAASINPDGLKALVSASRNIEVALGINGKFPSRGEQLTKQFARRFIVAKRQIKKGEKISIDDIAFKRCGFGLSPMNVEEILDTSAIRDFATNEAIEK